MTSEEANSLILISKLSEKFTDKTTENHIENAVAKITASLKEDKKEKAGFLQSQIRIYNPPNKLDFHSYLTEIQNAITIKQTLQITYINNKKEKSIRKIEPIGLTFYSNQWHLIAWCWERNAYRDFKVKKINYLKNLMKPFRKSKPFGYKWLYKITRTKIN